jgi:hypothetical protein
MLKSLDQQGYDFTPRQHILLLGWLVTFLDNDLHFYNFGSFFSMQITESDFLLVDMMMCYMVSYLGTESFADYLDYSFARFFNDISFQDWNINITMIPIIYFFNEHFKSNRMELLLINKSVSNNLESVKMIHLLSPISVHQSCAQCAHHYDRTSFEVWLFLFNLHPTVIGLENFVKSLIFYQRIDLFPELYQKRYPNSQKNSLGKFVILQSDYKIIANNFISEDDKRFFDANFDTCEYI